MYPILFTHPVYLFERIQILKHYSNNFTILRRLKNKKLDSAERRSLLLLGIQLRAFSSVRAIEYRKTPSHVYMSNIMSNYVYYVLCLILKKSQRGDYK